MSDNTASPAPENARADEILRECLRYFKLPLGILRSSAKHEPVAYQRQVVMHVLHACEGLGDSEIGRMVNRDPGTVRHGRERIEEILAGRVEDGALVERAHRDVSAIRQWVGVERAVQVPVGRVDPLLRAVHEELRTLVPRLQHLYELLGDKIDAVENPGVEPKKRGLLVGDAKGGIAK